MAATPDALRDPTAFFRLNEELARELARLQATGALARLEELLTSAGSELWLAAVRPQDGLEEPLGALRPGQPFDPEEALTARSRFQVALPDGSVREVYMPDHVCPACFNDQDNVIDSCARACARCSFRW